ncbi:MAG: hypothetical protein U9O96_04780 [Candidatus Thermoplasmatota archaeon]|nr:hypothetical protein [Candidatus Thermoplasmatota archaeon]
MEKIPLVYIERGKIAEGRKRFNAVEKLRELKKEYKEVYVIDMDGIKKNKSNLDVYKKVSQKPFLWIDSLPRYLEDVMDLIIVGAKRITVGDIIDDDGLSKIRDMCDGEIFLRGKDEKDVAKKAKKFGFEGIVAVSPKEKVDVPEWGIYLEEGVVKKVR